MDSHTHPITPPHFEETQPINGSSTTSSPPPSHPLSSNNSQIGQERSKSSSSSSDHSISYEELHGLHPLENAKKVIVTYNNYIMTDELLKLQNGDCKGGLNHHDEHLFIVVHQSFELWFKQILFELDSVQTVLRKVVNYATSHSNEDVDLTVEQTQILVHRLNRADQILRYTLGTFDILETMHPADFLEYRSVIGPASGFQSIQMRELEVMLGLRDCNRNMGSRNSFEEDLQHDLIGMKRLKQRQSEMSVRKLVYRWLEEVVYPKIPANQFIQIFLERKKDHLMFQKCRWFNPETEMQTIQEQIEREMKPAKQWIHIEDTETHIKGRQQFKFKKPSTRGCPFFAQQENVTTEEKCPVTGASSESNTPAAEEEEKPMKRSVNEKIERIKKRRTALLFIMSYRHHHMLWDYANLLDKLVALEEALLMWRTRHVRMVERMIGTRVGTGGSSGVDYLEQTLKYRVFLDLWESRSHFVQTTILPSVQYKTGENMFVFENKL
ncbi:hypothetical protein NAEGRDRAFT_81411 [Naegleria gruberi]|uniref:Uncharacterized protein AM30 n=1 Tax=Naegleria gruberi TaxID=5762 RepID=D2VVR1_NAEGR|nr:uncharacterized protein NAEGRDRAFT_81411 [Naegleria gruberi]EFC39150.1 hypothetical protein NAEGRDRAFT_81411 [Naegleria gruberi]|eukprot:XP_002671894.1 hypothetical protein NAEGRDRAFT_81411 [Naegleria gruberi strain NEG-M]